MPVSGTYDHWHSMSVARISAFKFDVAQLCNASFALLSDGSRASRDSTTQQGHPRQGRDPRCLCRERVEGSTSPDIRLMLRNVRMLRLGFYDARDVQKLLSHVAFPALKALIIINMYGDNAWGIMRDAYARLMSELFDTMIHLLPLDQITFLILRYVEFREERFPAWASVEHGYVEEEDLPVPLKLMASLTSLRHLFLISPDNATLTSMNYPIPFIRQSETEDSVSRLPLVLPNLSVLRITALSPKKYSHVLDWIVQRHSILRATLAEHYHDGPFLRTLHLCLPEDAEVMVNTLGYPALACGETVSYHPGTERMTDSVMHDNL